MTGSRGELRRAALASLAPAVLLAGLFIFLPLFLSLYMGLCDWPLAGPGPQFVGMQNYSRLLSDREFWRSLETTSLYVAASVPTGAAVSLLLAIGLHGAVRGRHWLRMLFYLPVVIPSVASALFWRGAFQPQVGIVNAGLRALGLPAPAWLASPTWAMLALVIVSVWRDAGYHMVIFLTGLSAIPAVHYEAARVDGAGAWARFRYVTWPQLWPTTIFVLITGGIFAFQTFGPVYVLTAGGPARATTTLVYYLYERAFLFRQMGYGAALGWALVALIYPVAALGFWLRGRQGAGA